MGDSSISNLHYPYINTTLLCPVILLPNQMDNKLYLHLKGNLIKKLQNKCYKDYGYIDKIYSIEETYDGKIEPEDPLCSAKIVVKFNCKLCIPILNKEIICKIDRMNKSLIGAVNGPIMSVITEDKINKDKFFSDVHRNIRIKMSEKSESLATGMYVKVMVLSRTFSENDKNILVIGFLQDIATEDEINNYYLNETKSDQERGENLEDKEDFGEES